MLPTIFHFLFFFFQENSISWFKSNQLSAPLLLMSLAPPIDKQAFESITNKEFSLEQKSNVALWELEGTRRIIESGFVLRAMMAKEDSNFIDNVKLLCVTNWKMINYKVLFYTYLHRNLLDICLLTYTILWCKLTNKLRMCANM